MKRPISILITAYKAERFLTECLDSIEAQTYFKDFDNYSILLGIDGCEDTLKKALAYRHYYRNLRIFMMESNRGTFITMNTLLDIAETKTFIRFDSDDIMLPNMVETLMAAEEDYGIVQCKYQNFLDGTDSIHKNNTQHAGGTILAKREIFDILGGYLPWVCAADTEFLWRAERYVPIKKLEDVLFLRRIHYDSLTRNPATGLKSLLRSSYREQMDKEKAKGFPNPKAKKYVSKYVEK